MATQRRRNRQTISQKALFGGNKVTGSNNPINEAKRQTRADKQAYKKDRANGDNTMKNLALDFGSNYHGGGPSDIQTQGRGHIVRKAIEDSSSGLKSENAKPIERSVKKKLPPAVQDRQKELDDLKKMEGIDELKKKKTSKA